MGRRALRRIDPALDLSEHLKTWEQLPQPLLVESLFDASGPLELEVGSGKGLFLATASGEHPERNFMGCEISRKYARFAAAKLARLQRRNALVLHGDAQRLFEHLPTACAAAVHIYFPDPWWKQRHLRRRIMKVDFARQVERVLEPEGRLHFWTDVEDYYRSAREVIASSTCLEGDFPVTEHPAESDPEFRTHFERRMRLHGVDVWRLEFRRP
jgi:tRNA (guanine-N7-)-methyltransferase